MAASTSPNVLPAAERPWLPPWGLLVGQLAHGASWLLLAVLAGRQALGFSLPGLAWVHLVALGWLSLVAISVLFHVFPGVLDLPWRGERWARAALAPFALGTLGLVGGFWWGEPRAIAGGGTLAVAGLAVILGCAAVTLLGFRRSADASPAAVRAFGLVLALLKLTALLGLGMAWAIAGVGPAGWLAVGAVVHAHLGVVGWLGLLVMGVSTRTFRRLSGASSPARWKHVLASSLVLGGLGGVVVGTLGAGHGVTLGGGVACVLGATLYACDAIAMMRRAPDPHRTPQAFVALAALYFPAAAGLGLWVLAGHPEAASAYLFLGLVGWLGQTVNGHLFHIGVRLLATLTRGEDDETEPVELLDPRLSWLAFAASQLAVVGVTVGLLAARAPWVEASALLGFFGWLAMVANAARAVQQARRLQPPGRVVSAPRF